MRQTIIVANGTAMAATRLDQARARRHGVQVLTIEQVAARLAGGFLDPIEADALAGATALALREMPAEDLGDFVAIGALPGLPGAVVATLQKVWRAGLDLPAMAAELPGTSRLAVLARLEAAILIRLPPVMLRPQDLVDRAMARLGHAPAVLGPVQCGPLLYVAPCWERLLDAVGTEPGWWRPASTAYPGAATPNVVTCATARHEVIEAMRWARALLATGNVQAHQIAFAAAAPGEYDDLVLAMSEEANLDVHFAHGRRALTTRDGQAAAALADIVLNGLSRDRVCRLARLAHDPATAFGRLPRDWARDLPAAAPLGTPDRWRQAAAGLASADRSSLLAAIDLLAGGVAQAAQIGDAVLRGTALLLWQRALQRAPASALESSLAGLRMPDTVEPAASIGWMHAGSLATCPRPHVWLLGLNARTWPRASSEDPLLPGHIVSSELLEPMSITQLDRDAFHAICANAGSIPGASLTCSASRRDATGRLLGLSPLLPHGSVPERLRRARIPGHAMSEQDRMMARPAEFATTSRAQSAITCWRDWNSPGITAHDGLVRPQHPVLARALDRIQSASSLATLLRNPLGFTWRYALGWKEPESAAETMQLEPMAFGALVHAILDAALPDIGDAGGIGSASDAAIQAAVTTARLAVATAWESAQPIPPALLWAHTLDEAAAMAVTALSWPLEPFPGQSSHTELAFGDPEARLSDRPWDRARPVTIPGTPIRIRGRIDRLDLAADGSRARVVDYKTGKPRGPGIIEGGGELQRCLYAYAAKALLGSKVEVEAALLFLRGESAGYHPLGDTAAALDTLTEALLAARLSLLEGRALPGPDTGGAYDRLNFALPANPDVGSSHKLEASRLALGAAATVWELP